MIDARRDLGRARNVTPEAQGRPGKRTFRLLIEAQNGSASVWLQKEQLGALATAIQKFIEDLPKINQTSGTLDIHVQASREPYFDFQLASVGLAYDETNNLFAILAYEAEDLGKDKATLVCWTSRSQIEAVAEESLEVVQAGRPPCPLCKLPMDPEGHVCVRTNGHKKTLDEL